MSKRTGPALKDAGRGGTPPRGRELREALNANAQTVQNLNAALGQLPIDGGRGRRADPFARGHHARVEQLRRQVVTIVRTLGDWLAALEAELQRCTRNQGRIGTGLSRLRSQEASQGLTKAQQALDEECRALQEDRNAVFMESERVKGVLAKAESRLRSGGSVTVMRG